MNLHPELINDYYERGERSTILDWAITILLPFIAGAILLIIYKTPDYYIADRIADWRVR